jgi:hypothetical protein
VATRINLINEGIFEGGDYASLQNVCVKHKQSITLKENPNK